MRTYHGTDVVRAAEVLIDAIRNGDCDCLELRYFVVR